MISAQRNLWPFNPLEFWKEKDRTKWFIFSHFKVHLLNHSGQDASSVPALSPACLGWETIPLASPPGGVHATWVQAESRAAAPLLGAQGQRHGSPSPPALALALITRDYPQVSYQLWGGLIYSLISGRQTGSWQSDLGWLRQKKIERDFQRI